jgi:hypothetical protein
MQSRRPDIYGKQDLEDGRRIALSIWVEDNRLNIRVSERDKEGKWKELLARNFWKSDLR